MDGCQLVAWNLRKLRVARELSQEVLAVDAGIDRTYVGRLERGIENPSVSVLDRLAAALGAHISEFFAVPKPGEARAKPLRSGRKPEKAPRKIRQLAGKRKTPTHS
jgi:transcriptional regulator with XRE-family HTH domain